MNTPRHIMTASEASEAYGVDVEIARAALANLSTGKTFVLGLSGGMGSGKDTAADNVSSASQVEVVRGALADPLKREINRIINLMYAARAEDRFAVQSLIQVDMGVPYEDAVAIFGILHEAVLESEGQLDAYNRTPETRRAAQIWGSEVRRTQDPNYWVRQSMSKMLSAAAEGKAYAVTDVRFPNEADAILGFGGTVIRLDISPEVQAARIFARDGIYPSSDALAHQSEHMLDDYQNFTARINVDELDADQTWRTVASNLPVGVVSL